MSFEDYAKHISEKYKLGLAIAVIRNKPENLSTDEYIAKLKDKIESHTETNDPVLTNDFNIDDEDFNFDANDDSLIGYEEPQTKTKDHDNINKLRYIEKTNNVDIHEDISINIPQDFREATKSRGEVNNVKITNLSDASTDETNSLDEVLRTLKDIDENEDCLQPNIFISTQDISQVIPALSLYNLNRDDIEENMTICDNFPDNNNRFINIVSKSDTQVTVDERILAKVAKNLNKSIKSSNPDVNEHHFEDNIIFKNTHEMEVDVALNEILEPVEIQKDDSNIDSVIGKVEIVSKNIAKDTLNKHNTWEINKENRNIHQIDMVTKNNMDIATQDTILYTLHDFTQNTSHISQSQYQNIEIPESFIHGNKNKNISSENNNVQKNVNKNLAKDTNPNKYLNENIGNQIHIRNPEVLTTQSNEIKYVIDQSGKTYAVLESIPLSKDLRKENSAADIVNDTHAFSEENTTLVTQRANEKNNNTKEFGKQNIQDFVTLDFIEENTDEVLANVEEVVPFKVVKELSNIKAFLNRKERRGSSDGFSSDSGYRSDSQNSFKSARLCDDRVHQSGHCLYEYLIRCPLVSATHDIVIDISQVLGRLIDRLHEEEKYPPFLEQLLDKVDELLREMSRERGCSENDLLDKDETIQRLLLLNKSSHILNFSIEKIANILEKIHAYLVAKENLYELTNTTEIENLSYVFYTLECFIQMYGKNKNSSQTQMSQETKILKKSSITEIWRKKWNPDYRETKNVSSQEKSCVLTKCGGVLNKLVVDCMEGYGLVSFAALQCFNLLQS